MRSRAPHIAVVLAKTLLIFSTQAFAQKNSLDSDFANTLNSVNSFLCSADTAHGKQNSVKCRPPPPGAHYLMLSSFTIGH